MGKRNLAKRRDWPAILDDLVKHHGTVKALATSIDIPATTLYSIRTGSEPLHATGEAILAAHAQIRPIVADPS